MSLEERLSAVTEEVEQQSIRSAEPVASSTAALKPKSLYSAGGAKEGMLQVFMLQFCSSLLGFTVRVVFSKVLPGSHRETYLFVCQMSRRVVLIMVVHTSNEVLRLRE